MFVKPVKGRRVLRPDTLTPLPQDGAEVPEIAYWHQRIVAGDVAEAEPPPAVHHHPLEPHA